MQVLRNLTVALATLLLVGAPAVAVEVETPQFIVEIPGDNWEHLPLKQGATPWRYARDLGEIHTLFIAITWIPLDDGNGPTLSKDQVVADIVAEARRQAEMPGRKLLDWQRSDEDRVADGQGCWRYGADFQLAAGGGDRIDYRSRGFICHVPNGDGLAWLRYDELKDSEETWEPGYEKAAVRLRESLRVAE
jgi:hypothetical protein